MKNAGFGMVPCAAPHLIELARRRNRCKTPCHVHDTCSRPSMPRCITREWLASSGLKFWSTIPPTGSPGATRWYRRRTGRHAGGIRDIAPSSPGWCRAPRFPKTMAPSTSGSIVSLRRLSNLPTLTRKTMKLHPQGANEVDSSAPHLLVND